MKPNKSFLYQHFSRVNRILETLPEVIRTELPDIRDTPPQPGQVFEVVFDTESEHVLYRVREADQPSAADMGATLAVEFPAEGPRGHTFRVFGAAMGAFA